MDRKWTVNGPRLDRITSDNGLGLDRSWTVNGPRMDRSNTENGPMKSRHKTGREETNRAKGATNGEQKTGSGAVCFCDG